MKFPTAEYYLLLHRLTSFRCLCSTTSCSALGRTTILRRRRHPLSLSSTIPPPYSPAGVSKGVRFVGKSMNSSSSGSTEKDGGENSPKVQEQYQAAIARLNSLQTNAETLRKMRESGKRMQELNVLESENCLKILGISLEEIDRLNCIHVTGTKGKGSTSAFVEAILRGQGFKTGFFSSPHLVHVRERIRINGRPISKQQFSSHLFHTYEMLSKKIELMPGYFKFLTLMAFRIFCEARVDVAIVEVGIGGEHDCTNVIRRPVVCAITTLDFDHIRLLGSTLPEIAWHKAGIAKEHSVLLSVPQPPEALDVIRQRCADKKCPFFTVPAEISAYQWSKPQSLLQFGIAGRHQISNVSLALQITRIWLHSNSKQHQQKNNSQMLNGNIISNNILVDPTEKGSEQLSGFTVSKETLTALEDCRWPGRSQIIHRSPITYFLDGAHTPLSIELCAEWFLDASERETRQIAERPIRALIFHTTGDRDSAALLQKLANCGFELVLFCTAKRLPFPSLSSTTDDNTNLTLDAEMDKRRCADDQQKWTQLGKGDATVFQTVDEALRFIMEKQIVPREEMENPTNLDADENQPIIRPPLNVHVLVTGSLHLVGSVLTILDPDGTN